VVLELVMVAGVLLLPLPALLAGARGLARRTGYRSDRPAERASFVVLVAVRVLVWLLVLALSAVTVVSAGGALLRDLDDLPSLVTVFFVLDLLLATLVLLTFGRRVRRPARRPGTPARR
jgi:hypothetical protein